MSEPPGSIKLAPPSTAPAPATPATTSAPSPLLPPSLHQEPPAGAARNPGRAWAALRAARAANAIPGLDTSNAARSQKLNFAEVVWRAKWQEEQAKRRKEREAVQAAAIKSHGAFASIEYTPANTEVYRAFLKKPSRANSYFPIVVFCLVGTIVGLIGTGMRLGIEAVEEWRFELIFDTCEDADGPFNASTACTATLKTKYSLFSAACIFAGVSFALILASGCLVAFVAPAAAASGLPEVIAFLNGTFQAKIFARPA